MTRVQQERDDLAKADQHIADGEKRVTELILLIERLAADAQDTTEAEKLLRNYEDTLDGWCKHRELIVEEIARLEGSDGQKG